MASEVAPCMPLQLFRRASGGSGRGGTKMSSVSRRELRPQEVCKRFEEDLDALAAAYESGAAAQTPGREELVKSMSEDIKKQLQLLLEVLQAETGETENSEVGGVLNAPQSAGELLDQFLCADLPTRLVSCLGQLEFEVRKDVVKLFSSIVRLGTQVGADQNLKQYAHSHPAFFECLVEGYETPEIATLCGMILRSCARHAPLVEVFLSQTEVVLKLVLFTGNESFDISTDAFSSLREFLLTQHALSAKFLEANFREFFELYNRLLEKGDYVTQRQALKLLSDLLLERQFMRIMMRYIEDDSFLQIHMTLLRNDSKAIQLEAFHVFKIFVANPQKPPRVQQILYKNKEKLVKLLEDLKANRTDAKQFDEDKATIVGKLQALEPPPKPQGSKEVGGGEAASVTASGYPSSKPSTSEPPMPPS